MSRESDAVNECSSTTSAPRDVGASFARGPRHARGARVSPPRRASSAALLGAPSGSSRLARSLARPTRERGREATRGGAFIPCGPLFASVGRSPAFDTSPSVASTFAFGRHVRRHENLRVDGGHLPPRHGRVSAPGARVRALPARWRPSRRQREKKAPANDFSPPPISALERLALPRTPTPFAPPSPQNLLPSLVPRARRS